MIWEMIFMHDAYIGGGPCLHKQW